MTTPAILMDDTVSDVTHTGAPLTLPRWSDELAFLHLDEAPSTTPAPGMVVAQLVCATTTQRAYGGVLRDTGRGSSTTRRFVRTPWPLHAYRAAVAAAAEEEPWLLALHVHREALPPDARVYSDRPVRLAVVLVVADDEEHAGGRGRRRRQIAQMELRPLQQLVGPHASAWLRLPATRELDAAHVEALQVKLTVARE